MDEWINDAATIVMGFVLVALILRLTMRPAKTKTLSSNVRQRIELRDHLVSLIGEEEAHRLLRAVSARMARTQSDVVVLNKCIDLAKNNPARRNATKHQQRSGDLTGF